ncbi:GGDEF domain-containing protein [Sulfurimonas sp. HSL3-7]|uniref:GGDEF domain-containing protein n=1 Tax=Sulfonitrofixus jiaomeiensis TaxID=3131938 RepID=UPI0031F9CB72
MNEQRRSLQHDCVIEIYVAEEVRQAYARLVFLVPALASYFFFSSRLNADFGLLASLLGGFTFATLFHLFAIQRFPQKNFMLRKVVIITVDMVVVGAFFYYMEEFGILYSPMFLWIIIGNGMLFGPKYFYISVAVALGVIASVFFLSGYWHANWQTVAALSMAIILLPLYYLALLNRIKYKNDALECLLRSTQHQSRHDSLTRLPNRYYFESELERLVECKAPFALLFIDLDGFKKINDTYGHERGDTILREAALRLQEVTAAGDMAARLGGDEFVVIVKRPDEAKALSYSIIALLSQPYRDNGTTVSISASIGISYYPEDAEDVFFLKKYADIAMYRVKINGKHNVLEYRAIGSDGMRCC